MVRHESPIITELHHNLTMKDLLVHDDPTQIYKSNLLKYEICVNFWGLILFQLACTRAHNYSMPNLTCRVKFTWTKIVRFRSILISHATCQSFPFNMCELICISQSCCFEHSFSNPRKIFPEIVVYRAIVKTAY